MCTLTPCSEIPSCAAMSLLVLPRATFRRITCCLGVSGRWIGTNESICTFGHYPLDVTAVLPEGALVMTDRHRPNGPVGTAGARVGFICVAPEHLDKNGALVDHLTIHENDWAHCPSNPRTDGEDWEGPGGGRGSGGRVPLPGEAGRRAG